MAVNVYPFDQGSRSSALKLPWTVDCIVYLPGSNNISSKNSEHYVRKCFQKSRRPHLLSFKQHCLCIECQIIRNLFKNHARIFDPSHVNGWQLQKDPFIFCFGCVAFCIINFTWLQPLITAKTDIKRAWKTNFFSCCSYVTTKERINCRKRPRTKNVNHNYKMYTWLHGPNHYWYVYYLVEKYVFINFLFLWLLILILGNSSALRC